MRARAGGCRAGRCSSGKPRLAVAAAFAGWAAGTARATGTASATTAPTAATTGTTSAAGTAISATAWATGRTARAARRAAWATSAGGDCGDGWAIGAVEVWLIVFRAGVGVVIIVELFATFDGDGVFFFKVGFGFERRSV